MKYQILIQEHKFINKRATLHKVNIDNYCNISYNVEQQ